MSLQCTSLVWRLSSVAVKPTTFPTIRICSNTRFIAVSAFALAKKSHKADKVGGSGHAKHHRTSAESEDDLGAAATVHRGMETMVIGSSKKSSRKGETVSFDFKIGDEGEIPESRFNLERVKDEMIKVVEQYKINLNKVVERVQQLSPRFLDGVVVDVNGKRSLLNQISNVTVRDPRHLIVDCYDVSFSKDVEKALYNSPLDVTPLKQSEGNFVVTVPKITVETRKHLIKDVAHLSENARVGVRSARQSGQMDSKSDVQDKFISKDDQKKDELALTIEAKRYTKEVNVIETKARRLLLDS